MADVQAPQKPSGNPENTAILMFPSIVHVVFGIGLVGVFIVGCVMSMQTTEAWILSLQAAKMTPDGSIFLQFPQFFDGSLSMDVGIAFVAAFATQCVLLVTKIGLPAVHAQIARKHVNKPVTDAMRKSARTRMVAWNFFSFVALAVNALSDIVYSWHLGFWQALFFSGVMFVATFYMGTWGIHNIVAGMTSDKE
jgi:hypothetical protein